MTGEAATVTGSLVSTIGGAEQTDLALLAWSAAPHGGEAHATIEDIIGTGGSDVVRGDAADNTYVAVGGGGNGVSVFDGRGGNDTVDFSHVTPAAAEVASVADVVPNGIYVNLASSEHGADGSAGEVTVQAWTIGRRRCPRYRACASQHVETVVGTVGSDILVGNGEANTFVYTAADDASIDAAGHISTGPAASYGFDIYQAWDPASGATDGH